MDSDLPPHISRLDYADIYAPIFDGDSSRARVFVTRVEKVDSARDNRALLILHQVARFVWLADQIEGVAAGRAALVILFYVIAAEAAAKLFFGHKGEGASRKFVQRFFLELCPEMDRLELAEAFAWSHGHGGKMSAADAVDVLYRVRCDVVHEGRHYDFHLADRAHEPYTMMTLAPGNVAPQRSPSQASEPKCRSLLVRLTGRALRRIVLSGAVSACERLLVEHGSGTPRCSKSRLKSSRHGQRCNAPVISFLEGLRVLSEQL